MLHIYGICTECGTALFPDIEHSWLTCLRCNKNYSIKSEDVSSLLNDKVWAPKLQVLCESVQACQNLEERVNRRVDELDAEGCQEVADYVHKEWAKVKTAADEAFSACTNDSDIMTVHHAETWITLKQRMKNAIQCFSQKYEMPLI